MSVLNISAVSALTWDGRAGSLEAQALLPFSSREEFNLPVDEAIIKLRRHGYEEKFVAAFGTGLSSENLAKALACYQRTLLAGDSPFDRFLFSGESNAISESAKSGFEVFLRVGCDRCHLIMTPGLHPFALNWVMFTDNKFHNLGVDADRETPDPGRYAVTGERSDWGAFRTPSLRNVSVTAPYFHDGSSATLEDVVEVYDKGGKPNVNLDPAIKPLQLSSKDKADLVAFLHSLTSRQVRINGYSQQIVKK